MSPRNNYTDARDASSALWRTLEVTRVLAPTTFLSAPLDPEMALHSSLHELKGPEP